MAKRAADKFDDTAAPCGARVIAQRSVADLVPYANNARTHSDAQVAQIAGSIREFGFNNPVLVDGANGIIAGHGRVLAARKLGLDNVPVIELAHLSDAQKRAYILADNRLADLSGLGIDLRDLGFDGAELDALFEHRAADGREEETPELPAKPVSGPGDLWHLRAQRLLCGDATDPDAVKQLLNGVTPHLMVTEPREPETRTGHLRLAHNCQFR
ncbi:ParB/Srx family N-terminal domain-containing protein [Antarctobacter sp.]|uniref:ParB/Srx family N-terminal domain-containing protein n=1 Tax=Antarctobacter sp. TaxID=1872577 RepID=UPI003A94546B